MLVHHLCGQRNRIAGGGDGIRPNLQSQLIEVGDLTDAGVFHLIIHLGDRGEVAVYRQHIGLVLGIHLVLLRGNITAAMVDDQLDVQDSAVAQRCQNMVGVEDLHVAVSLNVTGRYNRGALGLDIYGFLLVAIKFRDNAFNIENDLGYILFHTFDGGEFMRNIVDLRCNHGTAGQRRKQDPAQGVT